MTFIADGLLFTAAVVAALYCRILSIRLRNLGNMDTGLGGAISTLTQRVDELKATLTAVSAEAGRRGDDLSRLTDKSNNAARRLELLLASLHENTADDCLKLSPSDLLPDERPSPADRQRAGKIHPKIRAETRIDHGRAPVKEFSR